jgi:hypothetical protein
MPKHNSDSILPDWEAYSVEELEEALEGLDRQKYPERVPIIQRLLEHRRKHPIQHDELAHPDWEDKPDWAHYSLAELQQALEGLDCRRYPDRESTLKRLIEARQALPSSSKQSTSAE